LASRTPVLISNHPVFRKAFKDREGVRVFAASKPESFAKIAGDVLADPDMYRDLSVTAERAFERVECPTSFGDLLRRWKATF